MITIRPGDARGHANHGWLDSYHTFSFADYYDPGFMGFGPLRVINEDRVLGGHGFGTHAHRDMEIITYVLEGALEHKDSLGNGSVMHPGEVQRMSAGTGVSHSEYNHSSSNPVHFLQIWILPQSRGITPSYEQRHFDTAEKRGRLRLIAGADGRNGALAVHQDIEVYASVLAPAEKLSHPLEPGQHAWLQVARGELTLNSLPLKAGDGAAISDEEFIALEARTDSELLLFVM